MTTDKYVRKAIITAAITGAVHSPSMSEYLPLTPEQITDEAVRSYEAGAAIAHIHARIPETGEPTPKLEIFREIVSAIKKRCNMIICITTGGAGNMQERIAVVSEFKPELATLNCGSTNGGAIFTKTVNKQNRVFKFAWEETREKVLEGVIFENPFKILRQYAQIEKDNNSKPELEIWDTGQINAVRWLVEEGYVEPPLRLQFVMGSLSGMPATPETLLYVLDQTKKVLGVEFTWSVASSGRSQLTMAAVTLAVGGDVRVGMEDSLYSGYGKLAKSNAEQVGKVVQIAEALSIQPATPEDARQMLKLKGLDKVNF